MDGYLTRVVLVFVPQQINLRLRFGTPSHEAILDRWRRAVFFKPGSIFCRVDWRANIHGTTHWQLCVLQTGEPSQRLTRISGITPGARALLQVSGENNVQRVLQLIDQIDVLKVDPATVATTYWRTVHNRLAARLAPPAYTRHRHEAHLARVALQ